jgi:hypothetical protein
MPENMERHGAIFAKIIDGQKQYALHPYAVWIYKMKLPTMTANYYMDFRKYLYQTFAAAFLSTLLPQMRVFSKKRNSDRLSQRYGHPL